MNIVSEKHTVNSFFTTASGSDKQPNRKQQLAGMFCVNIIHECPSFLRGSSVLRHYKITLID